MRGPVSSDRVPRHEFGGEFVDDGADHGVEIGNLVMQLQVPPRQGLQADPISRLDIAVARQVRAPRRQGSDELHAGQPAQQLAQIVGCAHDGVLDHLQGHASSRDRCFAAGAQDTEGLDHPVPGPGRDGARAGEGGVRRALSVQVVVLATPAAIIRKRRSAPTF